MFSVDASASRALTAMRSIVAAHRVISFRTRAPSGLLADATLRDAADEIGRLSTAIGHRFATFRLSAAGRESRVMVAIRAALRDRLGIDEGDGPAELALALRRDGQDWSLLIRLSPRPSSSRRWRVRDYPGALDATIAFAMHRLMDPVVDGTLVNLACGSGTLLIERGGDWTRSIGVDQSDEALVAASANLAASRRDRDVVLVRDALANLPISSGTADGIVADLPFGMLGERVGLADLYGQVFNEAARITQAGARFIVVSTRRRTMVELLDGNTNWREYRPSLTVSMPSRGGPITPRIFCLERVAPESGIPVDGLR